MGIKKHIVVWCGRVKDTLIHINGSNNNNDFSQSAVYGISVLSISKWSWEPFMAARSCHIVMYQYLGLHLHISMTFTWVLSHSAEKSDMRADKYKPRIPEDSSLA
jgi:hypothetical protein